MRAKLLPIAVFLLAVLLVPVVLSGEEAAGDKTTTAVTAAKANPSAAARAAWEAKTNKLGKSSADVVWTLIAAFLVFFMQAGFALVETGFTRAKNAVNIIMKNLMDFSMGAFTFFLIGFGIMFGADAMGLWGSGAGIFSPNGEPLIKVFGSATAVNMDFMWQFTFWMFQAVFAATAATIVSGAMAERTRFTSYLIFSAVITAFIYPVSGHWIWGGGWLSTLKTPMIDFAGSTVVHSVGGWAALVGAILLGPRLGKYTPDGKSRAIPGHNIPLAALGVFILFFGWFGFNPGSTVEANFQIGVIAVTTALAAAAGAIAAMLTVWLMHGKPDGSMTLNGVLAGLVGITAGCANVSPVGALWIGAIAGVIVVLSVEFIDKVLKVDDPVGAVSVHGVCGAWGTLAVGLFADRNFGGVSGLFNGGGMTQFWSQLIGVLAVFGWVAVTSFVLFFILKKTIGLRVSDEEQLKGLDVGEHGMEAYAGFQIFTTE